MASRTPVVAFGGSLRLCRWGGGGVGVGVSKQASEVSATANDQEVRLSS